MIAGAVLSLWVSAHSGLNVRAQPSPNAQIVAVLPFGTEVRGSVQDGWLETAEGFLSADWLTDEDPKEDFTPMGQWRITAYYETGMATASGVYPEIGTTLAHNSLEFGAEVYIEGLGFWTVQDRGPASMGTEWCDIFLGDYGECVQFGETFREVWIVPEGGSQDD